LKELNDSIKSGFNLACEKGPLMDEQMQGAVFIIDDIIINKEVAEQFQKKEEDVDQINTA